MELSGPRDVIPQFAGVSGEHSACAAEWTSARRSCLPPHSGREDFPAGRDGIPCSPELQLTRRG